MAAGLDCIGEHVWQGRTKILVVEDEAPIRRILQLSLSDAGHDVALAANKAAALEQLDIERPELMILDLRLDDEDGADVLREARELGFNGGVLILSSHEPGSAAGQLRADAWMRKPMDPEELLDLIEKVEYVRNWNLV